MYGVCAGEYRPHTQSPVSKLCLDNIYKGTRKSTHELYLVHEGSFASAPMAQSVVTKFRTSVIDTDFNPCSARSALREARRRSTLPVDMPRWAKGTHPVSPTIGATRLALRVPGLAERPAFGMFARALVNRTHMSICGERDMQRFAHDYLCADSMAARHVVGGESWICQQFNLVDMASTWLIYTLVTSSLCGRPRCRLSVAKGSGGCVWRKRYCPARACIELLTVCRPVWPASKRQRREQKTNKRAGRLPTSDRDRHYSQFFSPLSS